MLGIIYCLQYICGPLLILHGPGAMLVSSYRVILDWLSRSSIWHPSTTSTLGIFAVQTLPTVTISRTYKFRDPSTGRLRPFSKSHHYQLLDRNTGSLKIRHRNTSSPRNTSPTLNITTMSTNIDPHPTTRCCARVITCPTRLILTCILDGSIIKNRICWDGG